MNENSSKILDLEIVGDKLTVKDLDYDQSYATVMVDDSMTINAMNNANMAILSIDSDELSNILSSNLNEKLTLDVNIADDYESSSFTVTSDIAKDGAKLQKINIATQGDATTNKPKVQTMKIERVDCDDEGCTTSVTMELDDAFQMHNSGAYRVGDKYYSTNFVTQLLHWSEGDCKLLSGDNAGKFLHKIDGDFHEDLWQMGVIVDTETTYSDGDMQPIGATLEDGDAITVGSLILNGDGKIYKSDLTEILTDGNDFVTQLLHWSESDYKLLSGDNAGKFLHKIDGDFHEDLWQMGAIVDTETTYSDGDMQPIGATLEDGDAITVGSLILNGDGKIYNSDATEIWTDIWQDGNDFVYQLYDNSNNANKNVWGRGTLNVNVDTGEKSFDSWTGFYATTNAAQSETSAKTIAARDYDNVLQDYQLDSYNHDLGVLYVGELKDEVATNGYKEKNGGVFIKLLDESNANGLLITSSNHLASMNNNGESNSFNDYVYLPNDYKVGLSEYPAMFTDHNSEFTSSMLSDLYDSVA